MSTSGENQNSDDSDVNPTSEAGKEQIPVSLDEETKTSNKEHLCRKLNFLKPTTKVFDGERWRESTRTILAVALLLNIVLTQFSVIGFLFAPTILQFFGKDKEDKDKDNSKGNLVKVNDSAFVYIIKANKEDDSKDSRELITLIWTSQVTLVGSALGFYFAANKKE